MEGFTFKVETKRLSGGTPTQEFYVVYAGNEADAAALLVQAIKPLDEDIVSGPPLSRAWAEFLHLSPNEVRRYGAIG